MPPRYAYWTIILEGKPTAFRAHTREELVPTFKQLQARHPDTVLMWFARGRLWPSQEDERAAAAAKRQAARAARSANWRPGGEHRDPRERFKIPRDEKRRRFAAKLRRDPSEGEGGTRPPGQRPQNPRSQGQGPWKERLPRSGGKRQKPAHGDRSPGPRFSDRSRGASGSPGADRRFTRPRDRRNPRGRGGGGSSR